MLKSKPLLRLAKATMLASIITGLASCQPLGGEDPLDQDAFAEESIMVVPTRP